MNVYLWAINLLGTKSFNTAWLATGRPDSDGWLETNAGKQAVRERGPDYEKWYNAILTSCGTYGYQTPRQVRLGVKFEL